MLLEGVLGCYKVRLWELCIVLIVIKIERSERGGVWGLVPMEKGDELIHVGR